MRYRIAKNQQPILSLCVIQMVQIWRDQPTGPNFRDVVLSLTPLRNRHQLYGKDHRIHNLLDTWDLFFIKVIALCQICQSRKVHLSESLVQRDSSRKLLCDSLRFLSYPFPVARQWVMTISGSCRRDFDLRPEHCTIPISRFRMIKFFYYFAFLPDGRTKLFRSFTLVHFSLKS